MLKHKATCLFLKLMAPSNKVFLVSSIKDAVEVSFLKALKHLIIIIGK